MVFAGASFVQAQAPEMVMTWKARTNVPSWYQGKAQVVQGSTVDVGVELVGTNTGEAGKLLDISSREIRWYVDGNLVARGVGEKTLAVYNNKPEGSDIDVRASVEYRDKSDGSVYFVDQYLTIPVRGPELVFKSFKNGNVLLAGASFIMRAIPFFFSVPDSDLQVSWSVADQTPEIQADPLQLQVQLEQDIPVGGFNVSVSASNPQQSSQRATVSQLFYIQ
jgi:hypothetical protein